MEKTISTVLTHDQIFDRQLSCQLCLLKYFRKNAT